ncbi:MAG TPA: hypothetical protein VFK78_02870 [Gemmatimonadales bacterium]|nr:hypothetical protein [Gemmatimonadales bacterium]
MHRTTGRGLVAGLAAAAAALAIAACSNDHIMVPPPQAVTRLQADSVAEVVSADADAMIDGATFSVGASGSFAGTAPASPDVCVSRTPASPANSDSDAVPDSVRLDFSGCVFGFAGHTLTITGTIDFLDPSPTQTDHALETRYTDFGFSAHDSATGKTRSFTQNGTRTVSGSDSVLSFTETGFQTVYTFANGATATHLVDWSAVFRADVAGTIHPDSLPSGDWDITGTSTWSRGGNDYSLAVTTNPQLHFNATCAVRPRFDAGTLTAVVTRNGATSTVTVQFTACGQYTVTRS